LLEAAERIRARRLRVVIAKITEGLVSLDRAGDSREKKSSEEQEEWERSAFA